MSGFMPPTGSAPAAGSSNTPVANDVSAADVGDMSPSHTPPGQQAPVDQFNYTPTGNPGEYSVHEPGQSAPLDRPQINTRKPVGSPSHLGRVIQHLRGTAKGSAPTKQPQASKGAEPMKGEKSAGLKSDGHARMPTRK